MTQPWVAAAPKLQAAGNTVDPPECRPSAKRIRSHTRETGTSRGGHEALAS